MKSVITRFAPSPTGYLHIGGARTALFNWLYARHMGGKFLLRIEDTDRQRSTDEAIHAIIEGLKWLELDWDEDVVFQFSRAARHQQVAQQLLDQGKAYHCYCSPEELEEMRTQARAQGQQPRYDGRWRDRDPADAPAGVLPVVRLKVPLDGDTLVSDLVQGDVRVQHAQLDDMVLLRADGIPTYMMAVVVDDHDMKVSHIIRGDDHLTNTFRQLQIWRALQWEEPVFAHIPLIHGADGAKLSKRHGALGVEAYREMGFLPEAINNYLLRLGWGQGDEEIISRPQAIQWFDIKNVGRSASRFDVVKLTFVNSHYLRECDDQRLLALLTPLLLKALNKDPTTSLSAEAQQRLLIALPGLKQRAKTLPDLATSALFLLRSRPLALDQKAQDLLTPEACQRLASVLTALTPLSVTEWTTETLEQTLRQVSEDLGIKMGLIAQPLRVTLTGQSVSPGIFEVMLALGPQETRERIQDVVNLFPHVS